MKLKGKVAVVTGAGRGIGLEIAKTFAAEGARLVLAARTEAEIRAAAAGIRKAGGEAVAVRADVSIPDDARRLVREAVSAFGSIDILVNNAGVQGPIGPVEDVSVREWEEALRINLVGSFLTAREVVPHMVRAGGGKIINLSGGGSVAPRPFFTAYSASKAGVVRLSETLAEELKERNIQVNSLAPGAVATRLQEEIVRAGERAGEAERIRAEGVLGGEGIRPSKAARLAVFLASADSDHVTGRLIHANEDYERIAADRGRVTGTDIWRMRRINPGEEREVSK